MKTFYYLLLLLMLVSIVNSLSAQKVDTNLITTSFKVSGVCSSCKSRIENAALIKGVKLVKWDINTNTLYITYRKDKVNINDIHKSISLSGHDTELMKAPDDAYNRLPNCCKYRDKVEKH